MAAMVAKLVDSRAWRCKRRIDGALWLASRPTIVFSSPFTMSFSRTMSVRALSVLVWNSGALVMGRGPVKERRSRSRG